MNRLHPLHLLLLAGLLSAAGTAHADACAGVAHCYDAGPFAADATSINPSWNKYHNQHFLRLNLRFRNTGAVPVALGFRWGATASINDNYGNAYTIDGNNRANVSGIGLITREGADANFVIAPGASRTASLIFNRWIGKGASGTAASVGNQFTADIPVEQMRVLPGSQRVEMVGQYSLNFSELSGGLLGVGTPGINELGQGLGTLINAFSGKK